MLVKEVVKVRTGERIQYNKLKECLLTPCAQCAQRGVEVGFLLATAHAKSVILKKPTPTFEWILVCERVSQVKRRTPFSSSSSLKGDLRLL